MDKLEKLFGGQAKLKIMKLFLLNPETVFEPEEIRKRANVNIKSARQVVTLLSGIGLIKKHVFTQAKKKGGGTKKVNGWMLDSTFPYLRPLQELLVYTSAFTVSDVKKRFINHGQLKLLIVSGVFIQEWDSRLDLLIVGDSLKRPAIGSAIKVLESEVGRELRYSIFNTSDFQYRLTMCDKLIRDVLDYPHQKAVNKLEL